MYFFSPGEFVSDNTSAGQALVDYFHLQASLDKNRVFWCISKWFLSSLWRRKPEGVFNWVFCRNMWVPEGNSRNIFGWTALEFERLRLVHTEHPAIQLQVRDADAHTDSIPGSLLGKPCFPVCLHPGAGFCSVLPLFHKCKTCWFFSLFSFYLLGKLATSKLLTTTIKSPNSRS